MDDTFSVFKEFSNLPYDQKLQAKMKPGSGAPAKAGLIDDEYERGQLIPRDRYCVFLDQSTPDSWSKYNVWPEKPARFREVVEKYAEAAEKVCALVLEIVFEGLNLPPEFVDEYFKVKNNVMFLLRYPAVTEQPVDGTPEHKDGNLLTLVAQGEVEGLEVWHDGDWRTVPAIKGSIVVNVGDILQVWSNNRYKSVVHRVKSNSTKERYSLAYFSSPGLKTEVKPIPQCTTEVGVAPAYRPFLYEEYMMHRFNNRNRISNPIYVDYYAV